MGAPAPPERRKKLGVIHRENLVSAPAAHQVHTAQAEQESILGHFVLCQGDLERELVVLEATTKKVVTTF